MHSSRSVLPQVACRRLLHQSALLVALLVLAACSTIKLAYRNLDVYLEWKADGYFSLDDQQRELLKAGLDATTAWHRREELSRYTAVLLEARNRVGGAVTEEDIDWLLASARDRYDALARYAAPRAARVLSSLSPEQIAHFETALKHENQTFAEEYVDVPVDVQRRRRCERTIELMEEWVGPLSAQQHTRMEQLSSDIPLANALRLEDRQRRQQALIGLLRRQQAAGSLAPELEAWMLEWDQGRSAEYEALTRATRQQMVAMVVELQHSLSPTQRERLQARLERYARDFDALAPPSARHAEAGTALVLLEPRVSR